MLGITLKSWTAHDNGTTSVIYAVYDGGYRDVGGTDADGNPKTINCYMADTMVLEASMVFNSTLILADILKRLAAILAGYATELGLKVKPDFFY